MMAPWLLASLTRLVVGIRARWLGDHSVLDQWIYFANHTSHLDTAILWSALPDPARRRTRPIAARDYWSRTAWRRFLASRCFHAVLIDRLGETDDDPVAEMLAALDEGDSLILFPEGTRGTGEQLARFRGGLYSLLTQRERLRAIPVYLSNLDRILPKGSRLPVPLMSDVIFGQPIRPAAGESRGEFLERARRSVEELRWV